ncbi:uncharacterized protein DMENIID0001_092840 [Sergentomyia squamirostris]
MSFFFDKILHGLGFNPGKQFGAKRRSEEREDEMDLSKFPRIGENSRMSRFGEPMDEEIDAFSKQGGLWSCFSGNSYKNPTSTSRKFSTSALVTKHAVGGVKENDMGGRSESLTFHGDIHRPTSYGQDQFIQKHSNQPLFLDRNIDIEISDDEDFTGFVPNSSTRNFSNFRFYDLPTNGATLKSPTSVQKPLPALIPRSSVSGRMRPVEKKSRFSSMLESSIFTRPSTYGPSNFRTSTARKTSTVSKENRFSRSGKMLSSVLKDNYNLLQKKNYKKLLDMMAPSLSKPRPSMVNNSIQRKPKIVDTINLADNDSISDDEVAISRVKTPTKAATLVQESLDNSRSSLKKTPIPLPINAKSLTVSSSESTSRVSTPEIVPVNTILTKFKSLPYYQDDWVSNKVEQNRKIREEYREKIAETEKQTKKYEEERKKEVSDYCIKKMNDIAISRATIVIEDSSEEEEEFILPELTTEQLTLVKNVTHRGSPTEVIVSKFNLNITRQDLCTLIGDAWLNDEVINFYMNLLTERSTKSENNNLPKVYAMNTFFAVRLLQGGHAGVKRWTRKVDIFNHDIIPVPVHVSNVHWCMAIIDMRNQTIRYYDSMGQANMRILDALEDYLKSESLDKKQRPFDTSGWKKQCMQDCPRQMNGSDCGVFSCMFAEYITRGCDITFTQAEMQYFRQKMILEIATGKLIL